MSPNHLIGGAVFTGTMGAFCGENMLQTKTAIVCTIICSLLPDIDNPVSPLGRITKPLSKWINRKWGHRTITHTLWALFAVMGFAWVVGLPWLICGLAYFSHLLFDMMTVQAVPLLFPVMTNPFTIPTKLRTGDPKTEFMVFGIFSGLSVFTYPLMANGFWTTYNNSMGTPKHLYSEYVKSTDLLEATYHIQNGSALDTLKGYVLNCQEERATIFDGRKTFVVDGSKSVIKSISFIHTGKKYYLKSEQFVKVNGDTLNKWLNGKHILEYRIEANKEFKAYINGVPQLIKSLNAANPESIAVQSLDLANAKDSVFTMPNFTAAAIEESLRSLRGEYMEKMKGYNQNMNRLNALKISILSESDGIRRENMMKERDELERLKSPEFDRFRESELNLALATAKERWILDLENRKRESEKSYKERLEKNPVTDFMASLKYFIIE